MSLVTASMADKENHSFSCKTKIPRYNLFKFETDGLTFESDGLSWRYMVKIEILMGCLNDGAMITNLYVFARLYKEGANWFTKISYKKKPVDLNHNFLSRKYRKVASLFLVAPFIMAPECRRALF